MRQPFNLSQMDLDELGVQAEQLSHLIKEKEDDPVVAHRFQIPPHLTLIASLALFDGLSVFYELGSAPQIASCWNGGCQA
jgi:hypothetical protein